ncbi:hypothetical protein BSLG_001151 [Batrachochytrium salamandrivorans]|nr:hypothetical protein BSLG_001151 [Batrachochytrium salamandrivorans]
MYALVDWQLSECASIRDTIESTSNERRRAMDKQINTRANLRPRIQVLRKPVSSETLNSSEATLLNITHIDTGSEKNTLGLFDRYVNSPSCGLGKETLKVLKIRPALMVAATIPEAHTITPKALWAKMIKAPIVLPPHLLLLTARKRIFETSILHQQKPMAKRIRNQFDTANSLNHQNMKSKTVFTDSIYYARDILVIE